MIAHFLRALFRRIDRHIEAHVSAALDDDMCALVNSCDLAPFERTPIFDQVVRAKAIVREITFGDEDFAEWDRELMVGGDER